MKVKKDSRKPTAIFVAAILVGLALIIGGAVALIISLNSGDSEEPETAKTLEEEIREVYGDDAKPIKANDFLNLDMTNKEIPYYEAESKLRALLSEAKPYRGCYGKGSEYAKCHVKNIDKMIDDYKIKDQNQLLLIRFEKAKVYSAGGMLAEAWQILGSVNEGSLLENQLHAYYSAMVTYYGNTENKAKMQTYIEKMRSVAVEELG